MKPTRPARPDETGAIKKKWTGKLPVALVFPNVYHIGMSNLGMQLVYGLVNAHHDFVCERVFLPDSPSSPRSVESSRPLTDFPILLCTVSFEQDYVNLVKLLISGGIEPFADKRGQADRIAPGTPLVVGGGVATFINPEPLAPYFDLFLLGEAEPSLPEFLNRLLQHGRDGFASRDELLLDMAFHQSGCYVPHFYDMEYQGHRFEAVNRRCDVPYPVKKTTLTDPGVAGHSQLLTADTEFSDLFLTELGRGCSRGCRFCAAGFVYRPPRLWQAGSIIKALEEKGEQTKRVGLLGMEMARADDLARIADVLGASSCQLSFSSLRADALSPELLKLLGASGLKTAAIAPDGGSERLRRVINKGITEEELLWAAQELVKAGVTNLKLYFMIGLPTETDVDLQELVDLTFRIRERIGAVGRARGRLPMLTVSLNSFVPKAWTPFQFAAFAGVPELKGKIKFLRKEFAGQANIRLNVDNPDNAFFQAVLARGDRKVGEMLFHLASAPGNWRQVFRRHDVQPEYYTRERERHERFPWEVIDHGIRRDYLWAEYRRALAGKKTPVCDTTSCRRCGVCDGK
ncbi:MAG: radical SAM protein [Proteobacteria bacterium]|nr:radical SAM protein [Pseudomonadota bacterium]MBU4294957.1 radical SAM protein [Pseudomonadota bacterium]MCG2747965.1 radical SAM protein [Desulfobulbaceae bacterium]